jgi:site-specific DNA recombinase
LTRSLTDFAKMVEVFDAPWGVLRRCHPAIQTTTSMGRLTLNVLLAFAQFEREVTAERIRDKIAASKCSGRYFEEYVEVGGEWKPSCCASLPIYHSL